MLRPGLSVLCFFSGWLSAKGVVRFDTLKVDIMNGLRNAMWASDYDSLARSVQTNLLARTRLPVYGGWYWNAVVWRAGDEPGTKQGNALGAWIKYRNLCNVEKPPDFCGTVGSALVFKDSFEGAGDIIVLVTYTPQTLDLGGVNTWTEDTREILREHLAGCVAASWKENRVSLSRLANNLRFKYKNDEEEYDVSSLAVVAGRWGFSSIQGWIFKEECTIDAGLWGRIRILVVIQP